MEGTNRDNRRAHADMHPHNGSGCIQEGQSEILSCFYLPTPLAKPRKIVAKLLLGGSLIDGRAELLSGVALMALVVAKHHSTVKASAGAPGTRERGRQRTQTAAGRLNEYN